MRFPVSVCLAIAVIMSLVRPSVTAAQTFQGGDVFVSIADGQVNWSRPAGESLSLVKTLNTGAGGFTTGMAFDAAHRLYVTSYSTGQIFRFDTSGTLLGEFGPGGRGSVESLVFAAAGNLYAGRDANGQVTELNSLGAVVATYSVQVENRGSSVIALPADQCTLFYTSEGVRVKRFNVCTNTQLADFAVLPSQPAYFVALRATGELLAADSTLVARVNAAGSTVQVYDSAGEDSWFALSLDPNGSSFWAGDFITGDIYRFNIATGAIEVGPFPTCGTACMFGIAAMPAPPPTDVALTKTDGVEAVRAGDGTNYTLVARNNGPARATSVSISDPLPAGTRLVSAPDCTLVSGVVTCDIGTLAAGAVATRSIAVVVNLDRTTPVTNTATVSLAETDLAPANNTATDTDVVTPPDQDGDGIVDPSDNCPLVANADQLNTDGDALGNACDPDDDNDTIADATDNCPLLANANQADVDGDGIGDLCDPDNDNDGVANLQDNCPLARNPDQLDTDGDGLGNACDPDDDADGVLDIADNCPVSPNPDQADLDGDHIGNVCDADDDNDGIEDAVDNCPMVSNPDQIDSDSDSLGDVCDATPVPVARYVCSTVEASPVTIMLPGPKGPTRTRAKPTSFCAALDANGAVMQGPVHLTCYELPSSPDERSEGAGKRTERTEERDERADRTIVSVTNASGVQRFVVGKARTVCLPSEAAFTPGRR